MRDSDTAGVRQYGGRAAESYHHGVRADSKGLGRPRRRRVKRQGSPFSAFRTVKTKWRCTGITIPSFWFLDGKAPNMQNDRTESP